jgi:ABC-type branched-subunit amino acid transport system ATPase component
MSDEIILNIDSVHKSFVRNIVNIRGQEQDERFSILDDLDLLVPKGKITALIGGNGAGKTTLFNIISGFCEADEGRISFKPNGTAIDILGSAPHKIARLGIGRMFQDNHIYQNMTVLENMLVADAYFFGERPFESIVYNKRNRLEEKRRTEKAEQVFIDLLGPDDPLVSLNNEKAKNLSYGQQHLLGLARLFMGNYKLLLLDEPTSGVNPAIIKKTMEIIKHLVGKKGLTIFLIEHNMQVVLEIADFCSFMSHGKITAFGTPEDVIGDVEVRRNYLGV